MKPRLKSYRGDCCWSLQRRQLLSGVGLLAAALRSAAALYREAPVLSVLQMGGGGGGGEQREGLEEEGSRDRCGPDDDAARWAGPHPAGLSRLGLSAFVLCLSPQGKLPPQLYDGVLNY